MKRILFVIGSLRIGGTEIQLVELARRLKGWQVTVFAMDSGGPLKERLEEAGARVIESGVPRVTRSSKVGLLGLVRLMAVFIELLTLTWRLKPRVIQSYLPLSNTFGAVAGRLAMVPLVICSQRGLSRYADKSFLVRFADRLAFRVCDLVVCNCQAVAEDVRKRYGVPARKLTVIYNGCRFAGRWLRTFERLLGRRNFTIVTVANLIPYKGHATIIRACSLIRAFHPTVNLRAIFLGEDRNGYKADLVEMVRDQGVEESIFFAGRTTNVAWHLRAADAYVCASEEEGCSNAILEAMAYRLPVIATRVGGNPELVRDGATGLFFQPGDAVGLTARILRLAHDPHLCSTMGIKGMLTVRSKFSVNEMVRKYRELYDRHLSEGRPCAG